MPILNWLGKDKVINHHRLVPYRVLEPQYAHGQAGSGNMLLLGTGALSLKCAHPVGIRALCPAVGTQTVCQFVQISPKIAKKRSLCIKIHR
jgi:hypothetical protein